MNHIPELLAPAGNFEKLKVALHYGADAVYMGGTNFSLRNFSGNFSLPEMQEAISYTHQLHRKAYITINIYMRDTEVDDLRAYIKKVSLFSPDAFIIADPGVFRIAQQVAPHIPIHISTQANITSNQSARFWADLGAVRVNTARELSLDEIRTIVQSNALEVESFVHGSMCVSYSGRCLLSSFMANRDSNRGECAHPCRWQYRVMEEKRPGEYYPFMEDERGTYLFNSHDLSMIEYLPQMITTGLHSLKIEGRMKSVHYIGTVVRAYRLALDAYAKNPDLYQFNPDWQKEVHLVSRHGLDTGFYLGLSADSAILREGSSRPVQQCFVGRVEEVSAPNTVSIVVKNNISVGDPIFRLTPKNEIETDTVQYMYDKSGAPLDIAHPNETVTLQFAQITPAVNDLLRKDMP